MIMGLWWSYYHMVCHSDENDILFADASEDYADLRKAILLVKTIESQNLMAGLHT